MDRNAALNIIRNCLAATCLLVAPAMASATDPLNVKTDRGRVQGSLTADLRVEAFRGIPYAAPPVGDLRWKEPRPAAPWKSVRAAQDFGAHCIQSASYNDMVFHDPGPSEDCLTLNVWTPAGVKPGSLPVMVWIYGGGFTTGGTSENRQNGEVLAAHNVVVVSMNYRLGIFGFFVHPELTAESPHHASGNYGLLDQIAALAWVRRNIGAFGGDPARVTIFGESAGSIAVSTLMASPLAKGLFAQAIGESGGAFPRDGGADQLRPVREQRDVQFAQTAFGTSKLAALRKLSAEDLIQAATAKSTPPPPRFGPDVDGYLLPEPVSAIYAAGRQAHVPLLAGWNADEGRGQVLAAKDKPTPASFAAQAVADFGSKAPAFLAAYPAATDEEALQSASDYAGDKFIAFSTWRWIDAHAATGGAPVFRYRFDLGSPGDRNHSAAMGAFHSDDIEYVFGTLDSRPALALRPEDRRLSDQMSAYWVNFARTGNPNGPGLPRWPVYDAAGQWSVMHLDVASVVRPDEHRDRYAFLNSVWTQPAQ